MTTLNRRLERVESQLRAIGCRTCQEWGNAGKIEILLEKEAEANPLPEIPPECPTCGRRLDQHAIRRIVITTRNDGPQ